MTVVVAVSCSDDDDAIADVTVDFETAAQTLRETDESAVVSLKLSAAAGRDGKLTFAVESGATYGTDYTTSPAAVDNKVVVPVVKGQTSVKFTVFPVNNNTLSGDRTIKFTLTGTESGYKVGEKTSETITLTDDEGPSKANYAASEGTLSPADTEGKEVVISFSSKLPSAGTLKLAIASTTATYGTQFTTSPAAANNTIELSVAAGATETSFTILPGTITAAGDVTFTLSSATGGVELGTQTSYALTLEASAAQTISVTALRALYQGSTVTLSNDATVTGIVISTQDNVTNKNIWLHDGTKGIQVRFATAHTFVQGDKVSIPVKGISLGEFSGVLQLGVNSDLPLASATKVGTGTLPAYKTITIADLNGGTYEGDLVKIENVHFTSADGTRVLYVAGTGAGNNTFTDAAGTNTAVLRVESYATFKGNVVPMGSGTLQGIANEYTGVGQITPQAAADIFTSNSTSSLAVSSSSLSFGDVANGSASTVESYTVSGTNLTADVTVTAPTYYSVSLTEAGTYGPTATITAANANAGAVTVYVKFVPTSGSNQPLAGSITNASTGAATQSVTVTGNETGNSAGTKQTLVLWTFDGEVTTAATDVNGGASVASNADTESFPAGNSSTDAWSHNGWDVGDYNEFTVNTSGYNSIFFSFDGYRSGTGPVQFTIQYSTDGTTFTELSGSATATATAFAANPMYSYDLSAISGLNNKASVKIRIVISTAGTAATGTFRVDNVKVEGTAL